MKKIFLFAIAAVGMTVGCQKFQEIFNPGQDSLDDGSPVPVMLGTNVSATATTKAAVTDLNELQLNILGVKQGSDLTVADSYLLGKYTNNTVSAHQLTPGSVETPTAPYETGAYYAQQGNYDFYGYYLGGAGITAGKTITATKDVISVPVTLTGKEDILIAKTTKAKDANAAHVDVTKVYSAYSARRGVVPTLLFDHQLTMFKFNIINGSDFHGKDVTMNVTKLVIKSYTEGNIEINNKDDNGCKFVPGTATGDLSYSEGATTNNPIASFTNKDEEKELTGSVMVVPGATKYDMTLTLTQTGYEEPVGTPVETPVPVEIKLEDPTEPFKAGVCYEVTVKVYAQEAVLVNVALTPWEDGEKINIDTDEDTDDESQIDETMPYAELDSRTETSLTYNVTIPDGIYNLQAGLTTNMYATPSAWVDVPFTRAAVEAEVTFNELDREQLYYCHLRYTTTEGAPTEETVYTTSSNAPCAAVTFPEFALTKAYVVSDETSYKQLPAWYQEKCGDWAKYSADKEAYDQLSEEDKASSGFNPLPWIAVECTPGILGKVTVKEGENTYETEGFEGAEVTGLFTICAGEMKNFTSNIDKAKTYTITVAAEDPTEDYVITTATPAE